MNLLKHAICFLLFLKQGLAMQPRLEVQFSRPCRLQVCATHLARQLLPTKQAVLSGMPWQQQNERVENEKGRLSFSGKNQTQKVWKTWWQMPIVGWPPKPPTVRVFGKITLSVVNLWIPTRFSGWEVDSQLWHQEAPGLCSTLLTSQGVQRKAPHPPVLERLPYLERQKRQTASSLTTLLGLKWDGNLLHLENQRWFCCCCFLFQQSREQNIDRKHRLQKNYYLVC